MKPVDHVYSCIHVCVFFLIKCVVYLWLTMHHMLDMLICKGGNKDIYIYIYGEVILNYKSTYFHQNDFLIYKYYLPANDFPKS